MHLGISMLYINNFAMYNPDSIWTARNSCDAHLLAFLLVQMLRSRTFLQGSNDVVKVLELPQTVHTVHTMCTRSR